MIFGRFLELALATTDIAGAVAFYERLGFSQLITGDAWAHRYGVLSDGRMHLALHEERRPSPALCFVRPGLAGARAALEAQGLAPELVHLGEESLHELRVRDPGGHAVTLLEARTYSPGAPGASGESLLGYCSHLSLPQSDAAAAREFWERGGFVALPELEVPYPHLPLTSDGIDLAFHQPALSRDPLLVFECIELAPRLGRLAERGIAVRPDVPRGLDRQRSALIDGPDGLQLLLLAAEP